MERSGAENLHHRTAGYWPEQVAIRDNKDMALKAGLYVYVLVITSDLSPHFALLKSPYGDSRVSSCRGHTTSLSPARILVDCHLLWPLAWRWTGPHAHEGRKGPEIRRCDASESASRSEGLELAAIIAPPTTIGRSSPRVERFASTCTKPGRSNGSFRPRPDFDSTRNEKI